MKSYTTASSDQINHRLVRLAALLILAKRESDLLRPNLPMESPATRCLDEIAEKIDQVVRTIDLAYGHGLSAQSPPPPTIDRNLRQLLTPRMPVDPRKLLRGPGYLQ